MSAPAQYRFLPWSRRGLVAELRDSAGAATGPLPARGAIKLAMTLSGGLGGAEAAATIAGPGDVVGIEWSAIVRTTPRREASNVEPNYLVAVDFDDADFPWLLTPSAANVQGQLRPWLALVVVEDRPGVTISAPAGAPLAQLTIESGATRELPDLTGSWAWAHTQLLVAQGAGAEAAPALQSDPDRHVSRLLCPRRLRPNARWHACLVPAFDAGVVRGLGQVPTEATLAPAWTDQDSITLPLYFHWSFGTGAEGDFESLARRLKPFKIETADGVPTVGTVKMHIGAPGGPVRLPDGHPKRIVLMDGALRSLQQDDGILSEIPTELRNPLARLLDDIADPSGTDPDDGAVGPPLYGSWPVNRFALAGLDRGWFAELNLDPRARVGAGLGGEVARAEQEDLLTACWQQVGAVLQANALLSRARLSIEASTRFHDRTIARLAPERVLSYAAPLSDRTPLAATTVKAAIGTTSLPDATVDPALRRLAAPTGRFVRKAARRASLDAGTVGSGLVARLAAGSKTVDPTSFVPAGVAPPEGAEPIVDGDEVDLSPIGLPVRLSVADTAALRDGIAAVRQVGAPTPTDRLRLRADLRDVGLITTRHIDALASFADLATAGGRPALTTDGISELRLAVAGQPDPAAFVVGRLADGTVRFDAVDVTRRGEIVRRTPVSERSEVLGRFEGVVNARAAVNRLPPNALRPGAVPAVVRPTSTADGVEVRRPGGLLGGVFEGPTVTVPPPVRDAVVIGRFEAAIGRVAEVSALADPSPTRVVVPFALTAAAAALSDRCAPAVAHVARVGTMVRFGGVALSDLANGPIVGGLAVSPQVDRIMAYPELDDATYRLLARYDRDRLLPGVDAIPPDSVTLLETNPRFVAAFLAGLNHEFNRELLWRRYPTDQRGTPMRRFWDRTGGGVDIAPVHTWKPLTTALVEQAAGESNLVLLVRGELLRRYPNTVVVAMRASGPDTPSSDDADVERPIFAGFLEPDVTFYGFDLQDDDLAVGDGWFFALQEQVTEPRFALDETVPPDRLGAPGAWRAVAWPDTPVPSGETFTVEDLRTFAAATGLSPSPTNGAAVADALFQHPVQVLVHARHLAVLP